MEWPAPREPRAGGGAGKFESKPLGLVEVPREVENERLDARVQRAKGGGVSMIRFLGEKGTRGWDSWVMERGLRPRLESKGRKGRWKSEEWEGPW